MATFSSHRAIRPGAAWLLIPLLGLHGCGLLGTRGQGPQSEPLPALQTEVTIHNHWRQDVGRGTRDQAKLQPILDLDRLYLADAQGQVLALNAETGQTIWRNDLKQRLSGGPGVGDGLVLVGSREGEIIALDEQDGSERWRNRVAGEILSVPACAQGVVVIHGQDGRISALDAGNGRHLWHHQQEVPLLSLRGVSSPVIAQRLAIVGLASGKLIALDLFSGRLVWETSIATPRGRTELERLADLDADPVVRDNVVYAVGYQGDLAAVSLEGGVVLWRQEVSAYSGLAADWRGLYVTDAKDNILALDPDNGAILWQQQALANRHLSPPALFGDYLLVGDGDGWLHWLSSRHGQFVARNRLGSDPLQLPLSDTDRVYAYSQNGTLAAFSLRSSAAETTP